MQDYKELKVWETAHKFTLSVHEASKAFPKNELYSLANQLRRAASSIPANIAEDSGENTQAEFAHSLNIALGSANESEYFLILSGDLNDLNRHQFSELSNSINKIKVLLTSLLNKVKASRKTT